MYLMTANPKNGFRPTTLVDLVTNFKTNFLTREIEIVPGLTFNQYETIKSVYFAVHNQFESGPTDELGETKYYYDLITDRNDQATKNINLNTKDVYIKAEGGGSFLKSWLLRREFMGYAKTSGFGMKLNDLADDLPDFGTVVWKKIKTPEGKVDTAQVELINIMNDPAVKNLKDGILIERHLLCQSDLYDYKSWDQEGIKKLVEGAQTVSRKAYLDIQQTSSANNFNNIDEVTPFYELFELWGEIPKALYEKYKTTGKKRRDPLQVSNAGPISTDTAIKEYGNESVYVMAVVGGISDGNPESVLFCKEVDRSLFPYKEVHYRRRKGRWLGVGNYEQCFPLIEKANEITNRFFASLRIALLHLYQTRDKTHVKNVMSDLLDGDVVISKSELTVIPTEIRGFTQYKDEIERIEKKADRLCNSFEVVTGENMPAGTPFKLGSQQLKSATKLFEYIQENMGLFIEQVFNEWLLPDFASSLTEEHILELMDDMDDIEIYYNAKRKLFQYDVLKRYILEHNEFPDASQLQLVGSLVKDQIKKGPKQIAIEKGYYLDQKYSIKTVITSENDAKKENLDTVAALTQVAMANPQGLQDPRLMKLVNFVLESSGFSPLEINAVNETPTNESLNPANQGGGGVERSSQMGGQGGMPPTPSSQTPEAALKK